MAGLSNKLHGIPESEESRGTAARLKDDSRGPKKGSPEGPASPNSRGDKFARTLVANAVNNPTLSRKVAMADLTANLEENQEPSLAEETRTSKAHRTYYDREAKNGKKHGLASPKPRRNNIASKVSTSMKMGDRVKKGEKLNVKERLAVRALVELRQRSQPPPKRGAVMKGKAMIKGKARQDDDQAMDQLLRDLPFPRNSESTTTLWDKWAKKGKRSPRIR